MTDTASILASLSCPRDTYACLQAIDDAVRLNLVEAAPRLIALLEPRHDEWILAAAAKALGKLGATEAGPALCNVLSSGLEVLSDTSRFADDQVSLGQESAYAVAVVQRLRDEQDVMLEAIRALGILGEASALPHLERGAGQPFDAALRRACEQAMTSIALRKA